METSILNVSMFPLQRFRQDIGKRKQGFPYLTPKTVYERGRLEPT